MNEKQEWDKNLANDVSQKVPIEKSNHAEKRPEDIFQTPFNISENA